MSIIELPLQALRLQYRLARFPLQFIEDRWIARMDAEAPARLIYERSFGGLDAAVGGVLGDSTLRKRGAVLARRSEIRGEAAVRSMAAARQRQQAGAQLEDSLEAAADDRVLLRQALVALPARDRELIALKYYAGLTNREIAKVVRASESNVGTRLSRIISQLRSTL